MARKKKADLLKAKQRKQKIFVALGGVALLAAAAFEVPMVMKQGGGEAAPPPPPAETSTPTPGATSAPTSFAPPTPGAAGAAPATGAGQLVDTDLPPQPTQTSLVGFTLFESKDPFVQQISPSGGSTDSATEGSTATTTGSQTAEPGKASGADVPGSTVAAGSGDGGVVPPSGSSGAPSTGAPATGSASPAPAKTVTLTVNGQRELVGVGGTFPKSSPTFRLVSYGKGTAEIGVVGGSYASGGQTVTLKQGVPLTLVNTTDDTRYRIVLVKTP